MLEGLGVFTGRGGSNREAVLFKHVNKWVFAQVNATSVRPEDAALACGPELQPHMDRVLHSQIQGIGALRFVGLKIARRSRDYLDLRRLDFPWAWKDPRNSYTAGLWKRVFPNAKLLHIYRHPLDVASSLKKREEARLARFRRSLRVRFSEAALVRQPVYCRYVRLLDPIEGVKLWEQYVEASFTSCAPFEDDTLHCRYETLLERPEETLAEIAEFAALPVSSARISQIATQVDPKRGLAYRTDPALTSLAAEIAHLPLVQKLGYQESSDGTHDLKRVS